MTQWPPPDDLPFVDTLWTTQKARAISAHHEAMGIRWYGWAVTSDEAERARAAPWPGIRVADERYDSPGWACAGFDKAWRSMQCLFADPRREGVFQPRPAFSLVEGDVTWVNEGEYEPHVGILSAQQVRAISDDLATVSHVDVRAYCRHWFPNAIDEPTPEEQYVTHYLEEAKEFAADSASRGHCAIYIIR